MKINLEPVADRTSEEIGGLVEIELIKISDTEILAGLKSFLIQPRMEVYEWDWVRPALSFPVWVVAESKNLDYGLVYADYGFGPASPWGLTFLSKKYFGADYGWFESLQDAYKDSWLI